MKTLRIQLVALCALLIVIATHAEPPHWTSRYPRFGSVPPRGPSAEAFRELFESTIINDVTIKAPSLREALPQVQSLIIDSQRAKGIMPAERGISYIIQGDHIGYSKPLDLRGKNLSVATVIDSLAAQGDFYWDFSAVGRLTLRATRGALLAEPKTVPARTPAHP